MTRRLLIRPGGIGDCLLCFPAMEALRADYTEVWVPGPVVPLVRFADHVRSIASTGLDTLGIPCRAPSARLVDELRSFDSIVSWYGANREEFAIAMRDLGLSPEFRTALPPPDSQVHAVDFFLGGATGSAYPTLTPEVEAGGAPYIAVHPFSGSTNKNWPLTKFRDLEARLPFPAVYCASPEQPLAGAVQYADLYRLAGWIRGAAAYIGNDSGITHLAAATGVPTVALFGYSNPRIWAPRGPHVRIVEGRNLADIETDAVVDALRSVLQFRG